MPQALLLTGFELELLDHWGKTTAMIATTFPSATTARLGRACACVDLGRVLGLRLITP
jgi:hypothetical protein